MSIEMAFMLAFFPVLLCAFMNADYNLILMSAAPFFTIDLAVTHLWFLYNKVKIEKKKKRLLDSKKESNAKRKSNLASHLSSFGYVLGSSVVFLSLGT